jgi:molecular chaperone GrpE
MAKKIDDNINKDFEEMQVRVSDLENQLKRAVADYHNLEKRIAEGRSELTNFAATDLIHKLLPVLDHLEVVTELGRGALAEKDETKEWFRGVELAVSQLRGVLKDEGLDEIEADGQFDPALHEAVDTAPGEDGKIIKLAQRGYTINGKVLRPAKVVVGRKES